VTPGDLLRGGRLGISQAQLGERLGWSRQVVTAIELGDRPLAAHELPDICAALDVGLLDLLSRADASDRQAGRS
jgi:transcriptional regulator with XRE-family HTH domain